ncbi:MAG: divergent PAP2 family protein [Clostridia bacterium]|nr:divergent PAP2 family protein [Clostridia bacterium]
MGQFFVRLFSNYCLVSAIFGWIIAQIIKVFTGVFKLQTFSIKTLLFGTGGMPSSHTASVTALCTAVAIQEGVGSAAFAISAIFTIIVMIDATGVRREAGKQAKALNLIFSEWALDNEPENFDRHFKELIGHTPLQVFFGALVGIGAALLLLLFPVFRPI